MSNKPHPSHGPAYWPYIDDEAEQSRREALADREFVHQAPHLRTQEKAELEAIAAGKSGRRDALVEAFYAGRESMLREGPTAEAAWRSGIMSLASRNRSDLAKAVRALLNYETEG